MSDSTASPWRTGRLAGRGPTRLLFGASYEDVSIERAALRQADRIFVIAASGDTAMQLASDGRRVCAVDVNPAQVDYVRSRLNGCPRRRGVVDRLLAAMRRLGPACGWTPRRVAWFLRSSDVSLQARFFDDVLDNSRFRALMRWGFAPSTLIRAYRPEFVDFLPERFGAVLHHRLRTAIRSHTNRTNPYAHLLLAGRPPRVGIPAGPVDVHLAEAAAYLESRPSNSIDGFALSNILDGPGQAFGRRLAQAVAHAGRPNAVVVLRTLREPHDLDTAGWARRDRSMIWGAIVVTDASTFPDAVAMIT